MKVAIIGAGIAGSTLALALSKLNVDYLLLEQANELFIFLLRQISTTKVSRKNAECFLVLLLLDQRIGLGPVRRKRPSQCCPARCLIRTIGSTDGLVVGR